MATMSPCIHRRGQIRGYLVETKRQAVRKCGSDKRSGGPHVAAWCNEYLLGRLAAALVLSLILRPGQVLEVKTGQKQSLDAVHCNTICISKCITIVFIQSPARDLPRGQSAHSQVDQALTHHTSQSQLTGPNNPSVTPNRPDRPINSSFRNFQRTQFSFFSMFISHAEFDLWG